MPMAGNYWLDLIRQEELDSFTAAAKDIIQAYIDTHPTGNTVDLKAYVVSALQIGLKGTFKVETRVRNGGELWIDVSWSRKDEDTWTATVIVRGATLDPVSVNP
jgi:hypothetical protein